MFLSVGDDDDDGGVEYNDRRRHFCDLSGVTEVGGVVKGVVVSDNVAIIERGSIL
jgi:hypothetical protein